MCGIAGYVDFDTPPKQAILAAQSRVLTHRGPDAKGVAISGACGLAHTRLSILDHVGGHQPMATASGEALISFGGEIYNFEDLRAQLLQIDGIELATRGDTEVLLRLIARDWTDGLPKLEGMFAFAIWDDLGQRLLLARDPIGEKPLFFARPTPTSLVFGSEIKAVLEHPAVRTELDLDSLRQVLRFRAVYGEASLHKNIQQLRPGSWLEFSRDGVRTGRFHDLLAEVKAVRTGFAERSDDAIIEEGRALFAESVARRMNADVPVGAFLSGGLDSSLIVAAMRRTGGPDAELRTYAVGFTGDPHTELGYARQVARHVRTEHTEIEVGPDAFLRRHSALAAFRDAPVSEPADVAIAELSRVAREDVRVVLCGEGADEVFAGYPKYSMARSPLLLRLALRMTGPHRAALLAGLAGVDSTRARVVARSLAGCTELDRAVQWFSHLGHDQLTALLPGLAWTDEQWTATTDEQRQAFAQVRNDASRDPVFTMQLLDCLTWLPGNMLERGDRMTMSEGLELRAPFLRKALVAYGLGLPERMKWRDGAGKWMLRRWARDELPIEIIERPKWGFRVPLDIWFRGPLRAHLEGYLLDGGGLFEAFGDRKALMKLIDAHMAGEDHSTALWSLYAAEVWYQDVWCAARPLPRKRRSKRLDSLRRDDSQLSLADHLSVGLVARDSDAGSWEAQVRPG